jgi:hypothetical protein
MDRNSHCPVHIYVANGTYCQVYRKKENITDITEQHEKNLNVFVVAAFCSNLPA